MPGESRKTRHSKGTAAAWCKEESFLRCLEEFPPFHTNFLFQLVEQHRVMLPHGIHQGRKQEVARWFGAGKKSRYQVPGTPTLPILAGQARRIKEGTFALMAIQKTLLEETVESGHNRGVRELAVEFFDNAPHAAFAPGPHDLHYLNFKRTQHKVLSLVVR